MNKKRLTHVA